jgi:hypothetical protein
MICSGGVVVWESEMTYQVSSYVMYLCTCDPSERRKDARSGDSSLEVLLGAIGLDCRARVPRVRDDCLCDSFHAACWFSDLEPRGRAKCRTILEPMALTDRSRTGKAHGTISAPAHFMVSAMAECGEACWGDRGK